MISPVSVRRIIIYTYCVSAALAVSICAAAIRPDVPEGVQPAELFPWARLDDAVPTQLDVLGFHPGARPLRHDELLRYLEALAEASPRASIETYAETHEGRPMVVFAVGDEATIGGLDEFRREHARRVDPRGRGRDEDAALLDGAKAVAWMAYGIHGDELSSVDAAAALAYWLVAGEDDRAAALRRNLVVLIDPCENPDGRERYLAQTRAFARVRPNPDTDDLSHTTVWPWGRGNHYLFDLNRDWFSMVHPESRRSAVIASWNPQLMVDSHEMGSHDTYLFSPPRHPFNPHLPPFPRDWEDRFAADQARALDERGYSYYTGEWNEEFFPGYGSSWASYRGAVGILYEMSGTAGTLVRQRVGTVRTFPEAIEHQVASSVTNLETLGTNRGEILREFVDSRRAVIERAEKGVAAWILPRGRNTERTDAVARLMRDQGIEVLRSSGTPIEVEGLRDARTGLEVEPSELPDSAWMVPLDQPAGPLARVILDPHVPMDAEFFREEREYQERGKGTRLYETTAWSLVLSYGLDAYWTGKRPASGWETTPLPEPPVGKVESVSHTFGYVMEGTSDRSVSALADMLQRGIAVRVSGREFRVDDRSYDRGAVLVKREGNPENLAKQLGAVAERWGVVFHGLTTAKTQDGPDLGGRHYRPLQPPRVGIWTGMPVSPTSYGALWHLMDEVIDLRFTGIDLARARGVDLARYNVLIFPSIWGGASAYRERFGTEGMERLKRWIDAGGTAIGIGGGAEFLADKQNDWTKTRLRHQALDRYPPVVVGLEAESAAAAGLFRAVGIAAVEPEEEEEEEEEESSKPERKTPGATERTSPYDVAPILGAGARPFAEGLDQGTPVALEPVDLAEWLKPLLPPGQDKPSAKDLERADARLMSFSSRGTFVRVELDDDLWMSWGLPAELPVLVRARDTLVAEPPVQVPARFADLEHLHLGGLLWPEAAGRLAHTAYATREPIGRGQAILFLNAPEYRGWTLGTRRLLLNAVLYGPGLGTRWSAPW